MYEEGQGVKQNIALAIQWYHKAVLQDYAVAQYHLGRLYAGVEGVEANRAEAQYWLQKAAEQGYAKAKDMLAQLRKLDGPNVAMAM